MSLQCSDRQKKVDKDFVGILKATEEQNPKSDPLFSFTEPRIMVCTVLEHYGIWKTANL